MTRSAAATELPPGTWPWLYDFGRRIFPGLLSTFVRRRVHHRERVPATGAVVLVANHSSMLDGPLVTAAVCRARRPVFLIKRDMFRGVLGTLLIRVGQVPISRGTVDRAPLFTALKVLRGGGMVGVFPEGTRGTGEVTQVYNGAAWLARSGGAVLLPVACRGTYRPPGARRRWRPRVDVLVGEPLPVPAGRGKADLAAATEQVRVALATLVTELDRLRTTGAATVEARKVEGT
ncbi:MAG TPA: lysophospholipid acyltransferase family protein [Pseudonocardiaceae bacterium]|nr:lysophospholipid acyltransferase family protein [Pseudonocardiaceae bacterium]